MNHRGIDFGNVHAGSGVMGFHGEGYWTHDIRIAKPLGLNFAGMALVTKTVTAESNEGNMALKDDYTPADRYPDCIKIKFFRGVTLNVVALSNPGIEAILDTGEWQKITKPFTISIMAIGDTPEERLEEIQAIVSAIMKRKHEFNAPFAIQINESCPNTGHDPSIFVEEFANHLEVVSTLDVPIILKFSIASAPIEVIMELEHDKRCDAICVSNTVPYDWEGIGKRYWWLRSPFRGYNKLGGGVGGRPLRKRTCKWIKELRKAGFTKSINGGGGILTKRNIRQFRKAGADSVFFASAAMVRPHRVHRLIKYGNKLDFTRR